MLNFFLHLHKLILYIMLRLKEVCKEKGVTLNDLSAKLGISQPSISGFATGRINPSLETLVKIADVLGVRVGELFDEPERKDTKEIICPHCGAVVFRISGVEAV